VISASTVPPAQNGGAPPDSGLPVAFVVSLLHVMLTRQGVIVDNSQSGAFLSFHDPALRSTVAVVAEYAAVLTWAFSLLAYVSAGALMSPSAVVLLVPAVVVTLASMVIRRRSKVSPRHRSGGAHAL